MGKLDGTVSLLTIEGKYKQVYGYKKRRKKEPIVVLVLLKGRDQKNYKMSSLFHRLASH